MIKKKGNPRKPTDIFGNQFVLFSFAGESGSSGI